MTAHPGEAAAAQAIASRRTLDWFAQGSNRDTLRTFLSQVRTALGMEVAFISHLTDDRQLVVPVVDKDPASPVPLDDGDTRSAENTYCRLLAEGWLPPVVHDVLEVPHLACLPATGPLGIRTYVSSAIRLSTGKVVGTVCCFSRTVRRDIVENDQRALQAIADAIALSLRADGRLKSPIWPAGPNPVT